MIQSYLASWDWEAAHVCGVGVVGMPFSSLRFAKKPESAHALSDGFAGVVDFFLPAVLVCRD